MKKRNAAAAAAPLIVGSLLLSGCSIGTVGQAERVYAGSSRDATRYLDQARQPLVPANISPVLVSDGVYTSGVARRSDHGQPLPRQWERDGGFVLKRATLMPVYEIGTEITNITSIPVTFAPDVTDATGNGQSGGGAAPAPAVGYGGATPVGAPVIPGNVAPPRPDINAMLGSMGLTGSGSNAAGGNTAGAVGGVIHPLVGTQSAMRVEFQGRLSDFLNQMSAHFGVSWEFSGGEIRIFRSVTRTYTVHALPSSIDLHSSLNADSTSSGSGSSSSAGATGGSNQKINSSVTVEIWKDITTAVNGIVGSSGRVTTAVSTGTITVTAPPPVISRVQAYLDGQNERLNKQVTVSVQVLNVTLTDSDNYNLDLQAAFAKASQYGITFASPTAAIPAAAGQFAASVTNPNSRFNGSKAIVNALSSAGKVTIRTTASVTTLNGVPAPLQVANTRGYVQNVSVTSTASGTTGSAATQTTLNTATVTTGFSLSVLPRIDSDGQGLLMQFGINISDLNGATNGFDNFTTPDGSETVQLPNINSRNFVQQAFIPNGSTLVLTGFEQNNNSGTKEGVGNPGFLGLGGAQNGSTTRNVVVILMTPTVDSNTVPLITAE